MYTLKLKPMFNYVRQHDGFNPPPLDPSQPPIESVLIVGGYMHTRDPRKLSYNDQINLKQALELGRDTGVDYAATLTVHVQNLSYGDDSLVASPEVHLAVFSYIFYDPHISSQAPYGLQSPHAFEEGAWHRMLLRSKARFAVNIGGSASELPTSKLNLPPYTQIARRVSGQVYDLLAR